MRFVRRPGFDARDGDKKQIAIRVMAESRTIIDHRSRAGGRIIYENQLGMKKKNVDERARTQRRCCSRICSSEFYCHFYYFFFHTIYYYEIYTPAVSRCTITFLFLFFAGIIMADGRTAFRWRASSIDVVFTANGSFDATRGRRSAITD